MRSRIAIAVTVVLGFAAWTVTASAENPHGTPPGQQQASGTPAATASAQANAGAQTHGKAQAKSAVAAHATTKTHGHAASTVKTSSHGQGAAHSSGAASSTAQAQITTAAGVKPSSTTAHDTHALASSNQTKLYGNGKTAGQIATQAGFGSATLHGPGNSQPHKVVCGPHEVDVHALKAHAAKCAAAAAAAGVTAGIPAALPAQASVAGSVAAQTPAAATTPSAVAGAKGEVSAPKKQSAGGGGVLGAKAELASATKHLGRGVLATVRKGTLPFTGLGLWLPIVLGLALIVVGYGLRRKAGLGLVAAHRR